MEVNATLPTQENMSQISVGRQKRKSRNLGHKKAKQCFFQYFSLVD